MTVIQYAVKEIRPCSTTTKISSSLIFNGIDCHCYTFSPHTRVKAFSKHPVITPFLYFARCSQQFQNKTNTKIQIKISDSKKNCSIALRGAIEADKIFV
jgi:hypothetical protein